MRIRTHDDADHDQCNHLKGKTKMIPMFLVGTMYQVPTITIKLRFFWFVFRMNKIMNVDNIESGQCNACADVVIVLLFSVGFNQDQLFTDHTGYFRHCWLIFYRFFLFCVCGGSGDKTSLRVIYIL